MSDSTPETVRILLIDDNPDDAALIGEMLAGMILPGSIAPAFELESADRLAAGFECLAKSKADILLLDLSLPDSHGLDTLTRTLAQAPQVPVVVLTGIEDEILASRAVRAGAQDYLSKGDLNSQVLKRSIRYAIERSRLQSELTEAHEREKRERELRSLESLSRPPSTTITGQTFGIKPLHEAASGVFDEAVNEYKALLDIMLEQRAYKVEHNLSESLRQLTDRLGRLRVGPRDVIEIHTIALHEKNGQASPQKVQAYVEEGRLLILQIMGHLVSFYRNYYR